MNSICCLIILIKAIKITIGIVCSGLIGCFIGIFELWSRYKSLPFFNKFSSTYVLINFFASSLGFYIVFQSGIGIKIGQSIFLSQVIIAGATAMAVLRSSFADVKINGTTFSIGFAGLIQGLLSLIDREYDRIFAGAKNDKLESMMVNIDFEKAKDRLTLHCIMLMQNLTLEEQEKIRDQIDKISRQEYLDNKTKTLNLGTILWGFTGPELLEKAIKTLGQSIFLDDLDQKINDLLEQI